MSALAKQIDELASRCCRKMDNKDRKEFFAYQKAFRDSGKAYEKKYLPGGDGTRYHKGARKGQLRDVFEIDGVLFNRLWKLIEPYATASTMRSYYYKSSEEVRDQVAYIRMQIFYVLRFFGPRPYNTSFSQYFKLVVSNVLTTNAAIRGISSFHNRVLCKTCMKILYRDSLSAAKHEQQQHVLLEAEEALNLGLVSLVKTRKGTQEITPRTLERGVRTRTLFSAVSLFESVGNQKEEELTLADIISDNNTASPDQELCIDLLPEPLRKIASLICKEGVSFREAARRENLSPSQANRIREQFKQILST